MSEFSLYALKPRLLCLALCLLLFSGCAGQVGTAEIRRDVARGDLEDLGEALDGAFEDSPVMINALNLARFYQWQGEWGESQKYFDLARGTLEEYEGRAIISVRDVAGSVGSYTLSRGSQDNFGTGYERSLLHTFNGLNYLMRGDFQGAAVEMRRMELRQELWLEESGRRLRSSLESGSSGYGADNLPPDYSMGEILSRPELRGVASAYQDSFSYALSAIACRIYGDDEYAGVSLSRACQLDERAYQMFRDAWQRQPAKTGRWEPALLPLPRFYREGAAGNPPNQEVVFIFFGGLAPALKMEEMRVPFPYVGYIMIDLPSYEPEIPARLPEISAGGGEITAYPLLRTDLMAYRSLRDDMSWEISSAISRAVVRGGVSAGVRAGLETHEDTEAFGSLAGFLVNIGMDVYASLNNNGVRNWELLPERGALGLAELPRGSSIVLTFSGNEYTVKIPTEARGVVILVSQVENTKLRVDHVAY